MASVFGISALRSRFDDWRSNFWKAESESRTHDNPTGPTLALNPTPTLTIVGDTDELAQLIERLVIPKLMADEAGQSQSDASVAATSASSSHAGVTITAEDVASFAELSLADEAAVLLDFVDARLEGGSTVEQLYIELLAPAARKLGVMWEEDHCDFVDVTMGLWRIQEVLRDLARRAPTGRCGGFGQRVALFSPIPGDQHSLGPTMISECFQRSGWHAESLIEPSSSELLGKLAGRHFDLVGLTVSTDCPRANLSSLISSIRSVSSNPGICVMVGGHLIEEESDLVTSCGADGTAPDAVAALEVADRLVSAKAENFASLA